jgi:prepilin-type N-terminal cleavage/methylation domain-containing protein
MRMSIIGKGQAARDKGQGQRGFARLELAPRPSPLARRRAFTLVEIVVVLLIMSVVLTMVGVSLSGATGGVAIRESAGQLQASLRYARYYAAIHNCECRVSFTRAAGVYELTCRTDSEKDEFSPMPAGERRNRLNERVRFAAIVIRPRDPRGAGEPQDAGESGEPAAANPDVITFLPTGECDAANIVLTDGRTAYTLVVAPTSGNVELRKGAVTDMSGGREDLDA